MSNFGQDILRQLLDKLVEIHGPDSARQWEEAENQFEEFSTVLRLYADRSGGTFTVGVDPRVYDADLTRLPFPWSYFMPSGVARIDDPALVAINERFWAEARVTWPYKDSEIRFSVSKMTGFMKMSLPGYASWIPKLPPLHAVCRLTPKRAVMLTVHSKSFVPFVGPTGVMRIPGLSVFSPVALNLTPDKIQMLSDTAPATTYFCPFREKKLGDRWFLRSSSIPVGEAFAADPDLSQLLLALPGLKSFSIGAPLIDFCDDFAISLMADPPVTIAQIQLLHQLVMRALGLLEKNNIIQ